MSTILLFLAVLGVLVLVHECGHALAARALGCRVEEFGFGFPPRLLSRRIGETLYSLNLIPLGGFVRITGEDGSGSDDPRSFATKSRSVRIAILLAGVFMNVLLAVVLFSIIAGVGASVPVSEGTASLPLTDRRVEIVEVMDNPVLKSSGIRVGDILTSVGDVRLNTAADAAKRIREFSGTTLHLTIERDGGEQNIVLSFSSPHVPLEPVGLSLLDLATYHTPWWQAPMEGVRATGRTIQGTVVALGHLIRDLLVERTVPKDLAGPVGIAAIVGSVSRQGVLPLLELTAVLSVNLALMNVLPIPALDGGRTLFVLFEAVGIHHFRGKPERLAHAVGFAILMILMALITIRDLQRLFSS